VFGLLVGFGFGLGGEREGGGVGGYWFDFFGEGNLARSHWRSWFDLANGALGCIRFVDILSVVESSI
jgi:hypothetical protein